METQIWTRTHQKNITEMSLITNYLISNAVVLDEQTLFADSFSLMLENYRIVKSVHCFYDTTEFKEFINSYGNQEIFIFLDYYLPDTNGLSVFAEIRRLNKKAKTIFVTGATSSVLLRNIVQYRPNGLISKSCSIQTVKECLQHILSSSSPRETYVSSRIQTFLNRKNFRGVTFTPREFEILGYFAEGYSVAETAERTFLSKHTVIAHKRKMMGKANCKSISQLLKYSKDNELL